MTTYTRYVRKVMKLISYVPKFLFFTNDNIDPYKVVSFDNYTKAKS